MNWFSGIVVYVCLWWVVLFAVLPFGIKHETAKDAQTGPGAPDNPDIKRKFILTMLIAAVLWLGVYMAIKADLVDFREMAAQMAETGYNQ